MTQLLRSLILFAALSLAAYATTAMFSGLELLVPVVSVIGITLAVGWAVRQSRRIAESGLAVLVQFLATSWAVLIICVPDSLFLGFLPSPSSLTGLISSVSAGFSDVATNQIPLEATGGLVTIFALGFGLLTLVVDGLVSDLRVSKVPALLLLTVWAFPVFFASVHTRLHHMAAIGAAFLLVLLSEYIGRAHGQDAEDPDALDREHTAGARPAYDGLRRRSTIISRVRSGLRRFPGTAIIAAGLALLVGLGMPMILPPITATPHYSGERTEDLTIVNPFLNLRSELHDQSQEPVFTYTTTDDSGIEPIRLTSVSDFDGDVWKPSEFPLNRANTADGGLAQAAEEAPGGTEQTADFSIGSLDQEYLPTPFAPAQTHGAGPQWLYDPGSLSIVGSGVKTKDLEYSVDYLSVQPTAEELEAAGDKAGRGADGKYTELPDNLPAVIPEKAKELTKDADTQWEKAAAIQSYFRSGDFTYSLDAPATASSSALADFMREKKGFCVQYSAAMASMTRSLGIPTRIGVGFTAGKKIGDGEYEVSLADAHAWPELYFDGIGWVRFEPTPGGPVGDIPKWTTTGEGSDSPTDEPTDEQTSESPEPTEDPSADDEASEDDEATEPYDVVEGGASKTPLVIALIAAAVIILLLVFAPMIIRAVLRRRRLQKGAVGLWDEITATAADAGIRISPAVTAPKAAGILSERAPESSEALHSAAAAADAERYGPGEGRLAAPNQNVARDFRKELFSRMSAAQRVRRTMLPSSLFGRR